MLKIKDTEKANHKERKKREGNEDKGRKERGGVRAGKLKPDFDFVLQSCITCTNYLLYI